MTASMTNDSASAKVSRRGVVVGGVASITAVAAAVMMSRSKRPDIRPNPNDLPAAGLPADAEAIRQTEQLAARRAFFETTAEPRIDAAGEANRRAAERAIEKVDDLIAGYRSGIEPFIEDITSWGTRFGVLKRLPSDWWRGGNRNDRYIAAKMSDHLFDDYKLRRDLDAVLAAYRDEITANRNAMIGDIKAAVSASDLVGLPEPDFDSFAESIAADINRRADAMASDSLRTGVLSEVVGLAGGIAVEQLIAQIFVRLSATAATGAGGTAATSAAAGGGGGTIVGGPVGTAVGIIGGLIVGLVIDWWSTRRVKADLRNRLHQAIDDMHRAILDGDGTRSSTVDAAGRNTADARGGLVAALRYATESINQSHREILRRRIVGDSPDDSITNEPAYH